MESGPLTEVLAALPAGCTLRSTPTFERLIGRSLVHASIRQACQVVSEAGWQDREAELSRDGRTVLVYGAWKWFPFPALVLGEV